MELKGKRILVAGIGMSGLAAARFLKARGARVTISDSRPATMVQELSGLLDEGIMVETGGHGLLTFRRQDLIVVSPGVPMSVPEIKQVRALGMKVIGELELGFQYLQGEVIAITGSNGKTTTTTLVGEILKAAGKPTLVGGNIGKAVTEMVGESEELSRSLEQTADSSAALRNGKPNIWSVLEVSSFQLETIETFKPKIAAVLNITPDHLDRHGSFAAYAAAKTRITENQTSEDFLVLNAEDEPTKLVAAKTKAQIIWFSAKRQVKRGAFVDRDAIVFRAEENGPFEAVLPVSEIPLAGAHNVENVCAAVAMAKLAGVANEVIRKAVAEFKAVEHRLEFTRELDGVRYFNDSKATNVDATVKAVEAFPGGIHLILGGKDKDSNYATMSALLRERVKTVITIGTAAEKIERQLAGVVKIESAGTMERAVPLAKELAVAGDVVLLAPACASFDQFKNYEQRGRVFKELVAGL